MDSIFRRISQSPNADAWRQFRCSDGQFRRLLDLARSLGFPFSKTEKGSQGTAFVTVRDPDHVLCVAESASLSYSPFQPSQTRFSIAFTEDSDAMEEFRMWTDAA
ncbi:hypothetical protein EHM69_00015 [candidate division KSB1 bacterium]|nr:MAG: hypothetical protein EHM69_00015 [candidate division KSB1 bacterium]